MSTVATLGPWEYVTAAVITVAFMLIYWNPYYVVDFPVLLLAFYAANRLAKRWGWR